MRHALRDITTGGWWPEESRCAVEMGRASSCSARCTCAAAASSARCAVCRPSPLPPPIPVLCSPWKAGQLKSQRWARLRGVEHAAEVDVDDLLPHLGLHARHERVAGDACGAGGGRRQERKSSLPSRQPPRTVKPRGVGMSGPPRGRPGAPGLLSARWQQRVHAGIPGASRRRSARRMPAGPLPSTTGTLTRVVDQDVQGAPLVGGGLDQRLNLLALRSRLRNEG